LKLDRVASAWAEVGSASNCDVPAKTRTFGGSRAKAIAADTAKPASDQHEGTFAAVWGKLASTRTGWANKAKEIAAGIARLVAEFRSTGQQQSRWAFCLEFRVWSARMVPGQKAFCGDHLAERLDRRIRQGSLWQIYHAAAEVKQGSLEYHLKSKTLQLVMAWNTRELAGAV
jgi:hypothetical protein